MAREIVSITCALKIVSKNPYNNFDGIKIYNDNIGAVFSLFKGHSPHPNAQREIMLFQKMKNFLQVPIEIQWRGRETLGQRAADLLTRIYNVRVRKSTKSRLQNFFRLPFFPG